MSNKLALVLIAAYTPAAYSQTLPPVASAQLIAHFKAEPGSITTNAQGVVQTWTALNNGSIVLSAMGSPGPQIVFMPTAMNGAGAVVFSDPPSEPNSWLEGTLPGNVSLRGATVFWLGHYDTTAEAYGRYSYSIGTDAGTGSSQYTHQSDKLQTQVNQARFQIYTGDTTHLGANIDQHENDYVVWRTEYVGGNPPVNHRAYANGGSLVVASSSVGYNVNPDPHPIFLGGWQGAGFNFIGRMSELIVYLGGLDASEIAAVEAYLQARKGTPIYTRYCMATNNGTGNPAAIHAAGSRSIANNDLLLVAEQIPTGQVGIFYYGAIEIQVAFGNGIRCIGGSTTRLYPPVTAVLTTMYQPIDNTNLPATGTFVAGGTFKFQTWFRDPNAGGSGFNLSDALSITFTP